MQAAVIESSASSKVLGANQAEIRYAAYIGMDVHKETIAVAVAEPGRDEPHYRGEIANKPKAVKK